MRVEKSKSDESNSQPNVTAELKVNYVLKDFLKISFGWHASDIREIWNRFFYIKFSFPIRLGIQQLGNGECYNIF